MNRWNRFTLIGLGLIAILSLAPVAGAVNVARLYKQIGTDPSWRQVLASGQLILHRNSTHGVKGSKIVVNLRLLKSLENPIAANSPIVKDIGLHTVGNAFIPRREFARWSRWYQEDGNVQIFRLFRGDANVRNKRPLAARVETYYKRPWHPGVWHQWTGEYTIIKAGSGACIFQVFNNKRVWAVHLGVSTDGNIWIDPRSHIGSKIIARHMIGKPFFVRVLDNGDLWRVYLNGKFIESGAFPCPKNSKTTFRWGMYLGEHPVKHEIMLFVSGATIKTVARP